MKKIMEKKDYKKKKLNKENLQMLLEIINLRNRKKIHFKIKKNSIGPKEFSNLCY